MPKVYDGDLKRIHIEIFQHQFDWLKSTLGKGQISDAVRQVIERLMGRCAENPNLSIFDALNLDNYQPQNLRNLYATKAIPRTKLQPKLDRPDKPDKPDTPARARAKKPTAGNAGGQRPAR